MLAIPSVAGGLDEFKGFILRAPGRKTVSFAGDTIWHEYWEIAIKKYDLEVFADLDPNGLNVCELI